VANMKKKLFKFSAPNDLPSNRLNYCNRPLNHPVFKYFEYAVKGNRQGLILQFGTGRAANNILPQKEHNTMKYFTQLWVDHYFDIYIFLLSFLTSIFVSSLSLD
jgi:hypothetical protein